MGIHISLPLGYQACSGDEARDRHHFLLVAASPLGMVGAEPRLTV